VKFGYVVAITFLVALIFLYEWPKMDKTKKKEKITFLSLNLIGWVLAVLLIFFPDMPGPTQVVETIFQPLSKILEK
jgi:Na+/melibiose symporter-like transporter